MLNFSEKPPSFTVACCRTRKDHDAGTCTQGSFQKEKIKIATCVRELPSARKSPSRLTQLQARYTSPYPACSNERGIRKSLHISRATTSTIPVIPYPRGRRHGTAALRHGSRNDVTLPEHRRFLVKLVNLGGHLNNAAAAGGLCYPIPRRTK
jgi:hypothetical protein